MHARSGQNTLLQLYRVRRITEMARSREDAMWAVLDWAATQPGEFTLRDMHRVWAQAGGGGDSASYQQFSTAINNYVYKFDPRSPKAKYRNPRYKYIRIGKTDKGTVPAPLEIVTPGGRGGGNAAVYRWRHHQGVKPMRQPAGPKAPIHGENDPVGDALDRLEKRLGRPALKSAMARWRQLGNLHKISADIMADVQIKGKDKMLALQVAASNLIDSGKATQSQADRAEGEMEAEVGMDQGQDRTPFSDQSGGFEDEAPTNPDATPFGSDGDADVPDDLFHGDEGDAPAAEPPGEAPVDPDAPVEPDQGEDEAPPSEPDEEEMRGTLVGTEEGGSEGQRIPVLIRWDEDEGATVEREGGDPIGPYEGFNLEVANGVLTQEAFDDLEDDGWSLVAAEEAQADDSEEDSAGEDDDEPEDDDGDGEDEPEDRQGSVQASDPGDVGNPDEGEYPAFVPEPDEEGDKYERAMFELVDSGNELEPPRFREDDPIWGQLRQARDSVDANRIIKGAGIPVNLHKYLLAVARAIFENTGRDFDTGKRRNESRLIGLYGLGETALADPVDFDQESGLERVYRWRAR